ncbi:MAG: radical SAM protein [Planctomycetes bacterium]|nr:radical SAM protein [Planctomycetota bacterium]
MHHRADDSPPGSVRPAADAPITRPEKDALLQQNRARLDQDITSQRFVWESMPRIVDLQLSNICNMACTMCHDGASPPPRKLDPAVLEPFAREVLPTAAVVVPFAGSEPLIVTWDLTRDLARRYDLELEMITNAQFLDEARFRELEPFVSSLTFSIDSHMRDVYERIRLRSQPDKVFQNLPRAARLCREHGIEPHANVVLMVENAAYMHETVAFLADQGCTTVRLLAYRHPVNANPDRAFADAVRHLSPEWLQWMLRRLRAVAREKRIKLVFEGLTREEHDFRPRDLVFRPDRKALHGLWEQLPYYYPGYCMQSPDRIKVTTEGEVYPCCVADNGRLRLGSLQEQSFQQIWNGPTAQDLRRAMLTLDLPEICRTCSFHTAWIPDEAEHLPFVDWYHDVHCGGTVGRVPPERRTLVVEGPAHQLRSETSPLFRWRAPARPVDEYHLAFGIAGTWNEANRVFVVPGTATEFTIPAAIWSSLPPNTGLWWCLWGLRRSALGESLRAATVRCLVRHQPIPRVPGSKLYERQ